MIETNSPWRTSRLTPSTTRIAPAAVGKSTPTSSKRRRTAARVALLIEAHVDAAIRKGLPAPVAIRLATATFAGSAELVAARDGDTLRVRREVTSPGGSTARGLAALEANGIRKAFDDAMTAVVR